MLTISPEEYQAKLKEAVRLRGFGLFSSKTQLVEQLDLLIPNHRRENQLMMVAFEANVFRILRLSKVEKLGETYQKLCFLLQDQWGLNPDAARFCVDTLSLFLGYRITPLNPNGSPHRSSSEYVVVPQSLPEQFTSNQALPPVRKRYTEEQRRQRIRGFMQRQRSKRYARLRQAFFYIAPLILGINGFFYGIWYLKEKEQIELTTAQTMDMQRIILAFKNQINRTSEEVDTDSKQIQKGKVQTVFAALKQKDAVALQSALQDTKLDPEIRNSQQRTLLMEAALRNTVQVLRFLIDANVDLNARDPYGQTALIHAAKMGHLSIVRELLEAGADPRIRDESGKTAIVHAIENSRSATVQFLSYTQKARRN